MERLSLIIGVMLLASLQATNAQGTFRNLGFESAVITPSPGDVYGRVILSDAMPGWTGYVGGVREDLALYNNYFLGSSGIALQSAGGGFPAYQGNFTATLMAGVRLFTSERADTTLSQTGFIPVDAQSLRFLAWSSGGSFEVYLGGRPLPLVVLGSGPGYEMYGADIAGLAGQASTLGFTVHSDPTFGGVRFLNLDSITFSTAPVPEAGTLWLMACGSLLLLVFSFNNPDAVDPATVLRLTINDQWRRVTDLER